MKHSNGSAILIVILFMSVLSIFCISLWQSSSLFHDISLQRLAYEQKYRAAQGGLNYAIAFCRKNFDDILKACKERGQTYQIELEPWKIAKHIVYKNEVEIESVESVENALQIKSTLFDGSKKNIFTVSCHLSKSEINKKDNFFIKHFLN